MHRIAAVLNLLTQLNKLSSNNFIRHECQNGILGGCFFILFDGYVFDDQARHVNAPARYRVVRVVCFPDKGNFADESAVNSIYKGGLVARQKALIQLRLQVAMALHIPDIAAFFVIRRLKRNRSTTTPSPKTQALGKHRGLDYT